MYLYVRYFDYVWYVFDVCYMLFQYITLLVNIEVDVNLMLSYALLITNISIKWCCLVL